MFYNFYFIQIYHIFARKGLKLSQKTLLDSGTREREEGIGVDMIFRFFRHTKSREMNLTISLSRLTHIILPKNLESFQIDFSQLK